MVDDDKRLAAEAAVAEIAPGMLVGLGTGSTAAHAIRAIGARGLAITAVATSVASEALAGAVGIRVIDFADVAEVDLTIDGVDEIDDRFFAIKGAGGAMLREKIVAAASRRMVVVADGSKRVAAIGAAKLPVEILPFARASTVAALQALGAEVDLRGSYRTDQGNMVADCRFTVFPDPHRLARAIDAIPGVLGHGLFLTEVDAAWLATDGIVTRLERARPSG
jgi:ribose 5-phosphate isomerase A